MKTIVGLSLALLCTGCDKATDARFTDDPEPPQHTIAYLKSLCDGKTSVKITQDITIHGFVTANDLYGEFYKTLVVEDDSGGITIAADHTSLADDYPFGYAATVRCNGLTLVAYGGKIELGTTPDENGAGRIPRGELTRYIRVRAPEGSVLRSAPLSFGEVTSRHIGTYVHFDDVRFAEACRWCDTDPETGRPLTTERTIVDAQGNTFTVRTANTCVYAKEPVPSGTGSLYGIIDYFAGKYTLRVTNSGSVFATAATPPTTCP